MASRGPEAAAVAEFLLLKRMIDDARSAAGDQEKAKAVGRAVKSRLREAPSLMLSTGTAGLITFYTSKSDLGLLDKLYQAFTSAIDARPEDADRIWAGLQKNLAPGNPGGRGLDALRAELTEGGKGYTVTLAMMLAYLGRLGLYEHKAGDPASSIAGLAKRLLDEPGLDASAAQLLLPFIDAAKRLVSAVVKGEAD